MVERMPRKRKAIKRKGKRIRLAAAIGILVVVVALVYRHLDNRSIDERLAAIEVSLAIPDSENAAILYDRLLQDPNASLKDQPRFLDPNNVTLTRSQPWTANDYPKLDVWIKKHQWLINELLNFSQFEKCQFPLIVEPNRSIQMNRLRAMRKWSFLLCWAANNDVGEGRIDDAIAKWQCMIQIGKHLQQQPQLIQYLEGIAFEAVAARLATNFLAEGNVSENQLQKIESFQVQTQDNWTAVQDRILPVGELVEKKYKRQLSLIDRVKYEFRLRQLKGGKDTYQIAQGIYLRTLVVHRGMYITVALRRYKNENGRWPQTLDHIKQQIAKDVLTDPHTNSPFAYKLTDDGFRLYSKGTNGKDENGRYTSKGPDDWPIWPPRRRISQSKLKDKDSKQSDTNAEKKAIE